MLYCLAALAKTAFKLLPVVVFAFYFIEYRVLSQSQCSNQESNKLKGTAKLTEQGEWVCLKDSKYICLKSQKIRIGRAVQAPAGQIAESGLLGWHELVRPFHV